MWSSLIILKEKKNYKIKGYKRQLLIGNKTNKKANDEAWHDFENVIGF